MSFATMPLCGCVLQVWPGEVSWPDYLSNANTSKWLTDQVATFYKQAPFGGLWCDAALSCSSALFNKAQ
jgi:hypothetical protein